MLLGIACENIIHPHDLPHKIFTRKLPLPSHHATTNQQTYEFSLQKEPHPRFGHQFVLQLPQQCIFLYFTTQAQHKVF